MADPGWPTFVTSLVLLVAVLVCVAEAGEASSEPPPPPPADEFPRLVIAHAMLWSGPESPRFRKGGGGASVSGFYENAPLVPPLPDEEGGSLGAMFADAAEAGIDAIALCWFDNHPLDILWNYAEAARRSGSGVTVLPCMDRMPKDGPTFLRDFWLRRELRTNPNVLRVGECPVVITYGCHGAAAWRDRIARAGEVGGRFFVISDTGGIEIAVTSHVPADRFRPEIEPVSGAYYFASHTLAFRDESPLREFMSFVRSFDPPKVVGASVTPGYIGTTRNGNLLSPRGTLLFRRMWLDVIRHDPDFVGLTTANDYSEGTEQDCSANSTFTFIDMNAYFGGRWRTGRWPRPESLRAFLSYRKAVVVGEPAQFELVLLVPDIGDEARADAGKRYRANLAVTVNDRDRLALAARPEVLPGHVCWRFWTDPAGFDKDGCGVPAVTITERGRRLDLPDGRLAAFAIVRNGETVARKWLRVPLHRVVGGVRARVAVKEEAPGKYPRTVRLEGLPWDRVAGGHVELEAQPLSTTLSPQVLRGGFVEEAYRGAGWAPMHYADHWLKRNIVDQVDRYTAVIRMHGGRLVFPAPALLEPPRLVPNEPYVDPATVFEAVIEPGAEILRDRGWLGRHVAMPGGLSRPEVVSEDGRHFLRFDGVDDRLKTSALSMPAGPVSVEVRLRLLSAGREQAIIRSRGNVLSMTVTADDTVEVARATEEKRRTVVLRGAARLRAGRWHHVAATFDGRQIRLYVDGSPGGDAVPAQGVVTDEGTYYGSGIVEFGQTAFLHADVASLRVLQRTLTAEEVARTSR